MKKLLFVLAFICFCFNSISQVMTLRVNVMPDSVVISNQTPPYDLFVITNPNGTETGISGNSANINSGAFGLLVAEINNIINSGYKLIHVFPGASQTNNTLQWSAQTNPNSLFSFSTWNNNTTVYTDTYLKPGTVFFFAVP